MTKCKVLAAVAVLLLFAIAAHASDWRPIESAPAARLSEPLWLAPAILIWHSKYGYAEFAIIVPFEDAPAQILGMGRPGNLWEGDIEAGDVTFWLPVPKGPSEDPSVWRPIADAPLDMDFIAWHVRGTDDGYVDECRREASGLVCAAVAGYVTDVTQWMPIPEGPEA